MALSQDEKTRLLVLLTLLSQGSSGRQALSTIQPILSLIEQKQGESKARKDQRRQERNAMASQAGGLAGSLGGMYLIGRALAPNTPPSSPNVVNARVVNGDVAAVNTPKVVSVNKSVATVETPNGTTQQVPTEALNDSGFWSSVNWNSVGLGATSLLSAYQAYKAYQEKDYVGAGIYGTTAATGTATLLGSQTAGAAMPYLGPIAGAYQGYKTAEMIGDSAAGSRRNQQGALGGATAGALIGSPFGPIGMGIGAAVGGAAGLVGSWTGSSKGKAQTTRDNIRGSLQNAGILDGNYKGSLADGSTYDFGKDGSTLKWKEIDSIAAKQPKAWNSVVPLADALAATYGFVGQNASDVAAWYAKGAVSNAGDDQNIAIENMRHFAKQQGVTYDMTKKKLDEALKDGRIDQSQYDYYLGGARALTDGNGATQPQQQMSYQPQPNAFMTQPQKPKSLQDVLRNQQMQQQQQPQTPPPVKSSFMAPSPLPAQEPVPSYRQPAPLQNQSTIQQGGPTYRPPAPLPSNQGQMAQPSTRPPAPLPAQSSFSTPPQIAPPANNNQGLLSLKDQIKQGNQNGNLDLQGLLGLIRNYNQQNGAKA
jgi:hypothetical protein